MLDDRKNRTSLRPQSAGLQLVTRSVERPSTYVLAGHDARRARRRRPGVEPSRRSARTVLRVDARPDWPAGRCTTAVFAVDGHDVLGLDDVVAVDELAGARMTGHVHLAFSFDTTRAPRRVKSWWRGTEFVTGLRTRPARPCRARSIVTVRCDPTGRIGSTCRHADALGGRQLAGAPRVPR